MRKAWLVSLLFLIGIIPVISLNIRQRPFYIASSTVIVDILKSDKIDYPAHDIYMETQREIIKSRRVAYHVIKNLGLMDNASFKAANDPVEALLGKLKIDIIKGTGVIKISVKYEDPKEASRMANEFARVYVNPDLSHIQTSNSRVQDFANFPLGPVNPNKKLNIAIAAILIMAGGACAFFLRKPKRAVIKDSGDVALLQLQVLGSVPRIKPDGKTIKTKTDIDMVVKRDPLCMASEAYHSIRARLLFSSNVYGSTVKSMVITSPRGGEGKTISAVNLAIMIAHSGEGVLLVDVHRKRPRVHSVFNISNEAGFSNYISGEADFYGVVKYPGIDNLSVVTSGDSSCEPVESISSKNIRVFLEKASAVFSKIIFDAPPVSSLGGMSVLLDICDGAVLVAESDKTQKDILNDSKELLLGRGVNIIGVILNQVSF
ncbi:MAG: polysaccharide biosynthesis tyrosine autokinase [Candidatus Omnitrophota bacterium]|nr:polysaccharide biosynthesis tyrosine autokinase [Candidatus Omnitrophota bacterium]